MKFRNELHSNAGANLLPAWLWTIAAVALLAGLYGRFKGLGAAPLGVDEFYISRSVDNVLRAGLPEFLCGGYYNRGLAYQYLVGLLRLCGMSAEFSGRFVAAVSSLAMLPAAYLLGRRLHGKAAGLLAVIVLALSIWEIEMARFARMYAPFQAIFVWYLLAFLHYVESGERPALIAMIVLSLLGVFTWEGGALMGIVNLLPPLLRHEGGRLPARSWRYLAGMLLLFAVLYVLATLDLRTYAAVPAYGPAGSLSHPDKAFSDSALSALVAHPLWSLSAALPAALALMSLRWIASIRTRWLSALGLCAALAAALAHQFLLAGGILALLMLAGLVGWRELTSRNARMYMLSFIACAIFWMAFGFFTDAWTSGGRFDAAALAAAGRALAGFPNVIDNIARPWGRTVPLLSLGLLAALAGLAAVEVRRERATRSAAAVLLIVCCVLVFAVGTSSGDRFETRYLFFLYPVVLTLAVVALARLADAMAAPAAAAPALLAALVLAGFMASEDFQPRHIAGIDSQATSFRLGMKPALVDHYYPHNDVRGAAQWLQANVGAEDILVSGIPSLDHYYGRADFSFLDEQDDRYEAYACAAGTVDRWTGKPLLHGTDQLDARVQSGRTLFLVMYPSFARRLLQSAGARSWRYHTAWTSIDGGVNVLVFNPR